MDQILYLIFKIILSLSIKKHVAISDNSSIGIYIHKIYNKIENIITFKVKTGCYLEILTPEIMKLMKVKKKPQGKIKNAGL